ncbi:hypothetical protein D3C75_521440 [compost metagenome]
MLPGARIVNRAAVDMVQCPVCFGKIVIPFVNGKAIACRILRKPRILDLRVG